jgi:hypothetical protein
VGVAAAVRACPLADEQDTAESKSRRRCCQSTGLCLGCRRSVLRRPMPRQSSTTSPSPARAQRHRPQLPAAPRGGRGGAACRRRDERAQSPAGEAVGRRLSRRRNADYRREQRASNSMWPYRNRLCVGDKPPDVVLEQDAVTTQQFSRPADRFPHPTVQNAFASKSVRPLPFPNAGAWPAVRPVRPTVSPGDAHVTRR